MCNKERLLSIKYGQSDALSCAVVGGHALGNHLTEKNIQSCQSIRETSIVVVRNLVGDVIAAFVLVRIVGIGGIFAFARGATHQPTIEHLRIGVGAAELLPTARSGLIRAGGGSVLLMARRVGSEPHHV